MPDERLTLTVEEAGKLLGVSRGLAYSAARSGQLPTIRVGSRLVVPRARLLALLRGEPDLSSNGNERGQTRSSQRAGDGLDA